MNTQSANTSYSLYGLYETLPDEVQQVFLEELMGARTRRFSVCSGL